jgi:hypothetical protein
MIDRFTPIDDDEFKLHKEGNSQGAEARLMGCGLDENPYSPIEEKWLYDSWNAGWADVDMDPDAPCRDVHNTVIDRLLEFLENEIEYEMKAKDSINLSHPDLTNAMIDEFRDHEIRSLRFEQIARLLKRVKSA